MENLSVEELADKMGALNLEDSIDKELSKKQEKSLER